MARQERTWSRLTLLGARHVDSGSIVNPDMGDEKALEAGQIGGELAFG